MLGTLMCGLAGRLKEVESNAGSGGQQPFNLGKGLTLCLIAGVFSAVYGIAINDAGKPIAEAAARHGAGHWQTNVVYIFANTGAFVTTALYTTWRSFREKTWREFASIKGVSAWAMAVNYFPLCHHLLDSRLRRPGSSPAAHYGSQRPNTPLESLRKARTSKSHRHAPRMRF